MRYIVSRHAEIIPSLEKRVYFMQKVLTRKEKKLDSLYKKGTTYAKGFIKTEVMLSFDYAEGVIQKDKNVTISITPLWIWNKNLLVCLNHFFLDF